MWLADGGMMRAIDAEAIISFGIPGQNLMEAAAGFAARVAVEFFDPQGEIVVVVGLGNNGGDGWGIARHLAARDCLVRVVTAVEPGELQGDALQQFKFYDRYGLSWEQYTNIGQLDRASLLIDALWGTGIKGKPRGVGAEIIAGLNCCPAPVLSVDIPSGLPAEFISPGGEVVNASATASFGLAKAGMYTPAGRQASGKIFVDPIGLPAALLKQTGLRLNDPSLAASALSCRSRDSHKGTYGHGLLIAGSRGMSGAALLAGTSALKTGVGLLTIACPDQVQPLIAGNLWESLTLPLPSTEQGEFSCQEAAAVQLDRYSAACIGPGCRVCPGTKALTTLLADSSLPLVIDADALNSLAPDIPRRQYPTVITPHPGEMARLTGTNIEDILTNPLEHCRRAAMSWECTVVLKGSTTCISGPDGSTALNITGTDGLATGGSGDILSGLILGFLTQGAEPFAAACAGTWLLGTASELAAETVGTAAQLPRDVLEHMAKAVTSLTGVST